MAVEKHVLTMTFPAGPSLTSQSNLYKFVNISGTGTVSVCTGATDLPLGVLQNLPASGDAAAVCMLGISKVRADANLAIGDLIGTSASGQADAKIPGTDTTQYVCGRVLEDTGAAGDFTTCSIDCLAPHRAS